MTATLAPANDTDTAAWLAVSSQLTAIVDRLIDRNDVIVAMNPNPAPAPGYFTPGLASIVLDSKVLAEGVDPRTIVIDDVRDLATYGVIGGVLAHEAGHAAHTIWPVALTDRNQQWMTVLEEPRIETIMAATKPQTRRWMQASVAHILSDLDVTDEAEAARLLVLLGGRLLGGVLDPSPALDMDALCSAWLTAEQIATITEATDRAVRLANGDLDGLSACAAKIASVMGNHDAPAGEHMPGVAGAPTANTPADQSDQSGDQASAGPADETNGETNGEQAGSDASPAASDDSGTEDPGDSQETGSEGSGVAGRGQSRAQKQAENKIRAALDEIAKDAAETMRATAGRIAPTPAAQRRKRAAKVRAAEIAAAARQAKRTRHNVTHRKPTAAERKAREVLHKSLRKAADRGIDVRVRKHIAPPGATDMRELVQRSAQRANGLTVTATPWTTTTRRRRPQPTLTVGIAADISPSQDHVTDQVGVTAWMLNALNRDRGGETATVTWHSDAAVLPVGRGDTIPVAHTAGMSGGLPEALRALDGILGMTSRNGARLLVVITDAALPNEDEINPELQRHLDAGVKVLWLISQDSYVSVTPPKGCVSAHIGDPSRLGTTIASAAIDALTQE